MKPTLGDIIIKTAKHRGASLSQVCAVAPDGAATDCQSFTSDAQAEADAKKRVMPGRKIWKQEGSEEPRIWVG